MESDIVVRHPLAEYLRECGYTVLEAATTDEAHELFSSDRQGPPIEAVLLDLTSPGEEQAFALSRWLRENHSSIEVILAGTVEAATQKAGDLCSEGPPISKPYDHQIVLDRIRRLLAARERGGASDQSTDIRAPIR